LAETVPPGKATQQSRTVASSASNGNCSERDAGGLAQAHAELALARHNWQDAITAASHVVNQSRTYGRPKYEALGLATRARAVGRLGLRPESADARASVEIARRLGDPALLLDCLSVLLELDGSDELQSEAQHIVERIAGALSQESWRNRFLTNVSSNQQLTSI
jgi:hypothetical protein